MAGNDYERLLAHTVALNLLVRGLYTKWALEAPDPRASNARMLDGMIGSMWNISPPDNPGEKQIYVMVEEYLREFRDQIDIRLGGEGYEV